VNQLLQSVGEEFGRLQKQAERALAQVQDERHLHAVLDGESNTLGILIQHVGGNLHSRFTSFLTTDGEKATRNRDEEFVSHAEKSRAELMEVWNAGWAALHSSLAGLAPDDLETSVTIRGEAHTVTQALLRALSHIATHVGQIIFLAKHLEAERWSTLTVPRGRSRDVGGNYRKATPSS
jgi:hypothetical protein